MCRIVIIIILLAIILGYILLGAMIVHKLQPICTILETTKRQCYEQNARIHLDLYVVACMNGTNISAFVRCGPVINCETSPCNALHDATHCYKYSENLYQVRSFDYLSMYFMTLTYAFSLPVPIILLWCAIAY